MVLMGWVWLYGDLVGESEICLGPESEFPNLMNSSFRQFYLELLYRVYMVHDKEDSAAQYAVKVYYKTEESES